jgi:hypothetical protein
MKANLQLSRRGMLDVRKLASLTDRCRRSRGHLSRTVLCSCCKQSEIDLYECVLSHVSIVKKSKEWKQHAPKFSSDSS